jgi:hypothetical protein
MTHCHTQDLALVGYSLAKLGLRPPQSWLRRYCTLLLRLKGQLWRSKAQLTQVCVCVCVFVCVCVYVRGRRRHHVVWLLPPPLSAVLVATSIHAVLPLSARTRAHEHTRAHAHIPTHTQVLVALSSFRVPRMDVWRRELYAAAGYNLYR